MNDYLTWIFLAEIISAIFIGMNLVRAKYFMNKNGKLIYKAQRQYPEIAKNLQCLQL